MSVAITKTGRIPDVIFDTMSMWNEAKIWLLRKDTVKMGKGKKDIKG